MRIIGYVSVVLFIATVWAANWAISKWGAVPVGFGFEAPAGVYLAGLAFTLRDVVHRTLGRGVVIGAILVGCALAYLVEGNAELGGAVTLATASAIAFLVSEFADLVVYEPIRKQGWLPAVVASNAVSIVVDSALFLWLAFGSLAYFWGQVIGKAWVTVAAVAILLLIQIAYRREAVPA
jgi:uncharacterized PurR-regulated membrane protein YhhQ (DUF165 family)